MKSTIFNKKFAYIFFNVVKYKQIMEENMFKNTLMLLLTLSIFTTLSVNAQANYQVVTPYNNTASNLQGYALFVPAGVTTTAVLSQEINSNSAVVGQSVNAILTQDFCYNNQVIAAAGSVIMGSVVSNQKAGFGNRNAKTMVKFTMIRTPYNNVIPISAVIATTDSTGVLKGGTTKDSAKEYAKDTIIGAGSGAALGTAMGALSGGSVGRGAVYGTAVGAGIGLIKRTADKGEDVSIPCNSEINILFNQPITITAQ